MNIGSNVDNKNSVFVSNLLITNITSKSFKATINFADDSNSNAVATLHWCVGSGCDPLLGTSQPMVRWDNQFAIDVVGMGTSGGEVIEAAVAVVGVDEVKGLPLGNQFTLAAAPGLSKIYRSVGPGNTGTIEDNSTGFLTISSNTATFSAGLAGNIGVGDVIVYSGDAQIAIISGRTSSTVFTVYKADGLTAPDAVTGNSDWKIYRAYTSLSDAVDGIENAGIPAGVINFDTWTGGRDLVTNNEEWLFAIYGDGPMAGGVDVSPVGWITGASNYLIFYAPSDPGEVGLSQRHMGVWDSGKAHMISTASFNDYALNTGGVLYVKIEGLQFDISGGTGRRGVATPGAERSYFIGNIIRRTATSVAPSYAYQSSGGATSQCFIVNNIIYGFDNDRAIYEVSSSVGRQVFIYNNTLYGNNEGIDINYSTVSATLINNISVNNATADYGGNIDVSSNNISSDTTSPDVAFRSLTPTFVSPGSDLHLSPADTVAKNAGADLSSDINYSFNFDIMNSSRELDGFWDIGAHELP